MAGSGVSLGSSRQRLLRVSRASRGGDSSLRGGGPEGLQPLPSLHPTFSPLSLPKIPPFPGEIREPRPGAAEPAAAPGAEPDPEPLPVPGLLRLQPHGQRPLLRPGAAGRLHQPPERPLDAARLRRDAARPHLLVGTGVPEGVGGVPGVSPGAQRPPVPTGATGSWSGACTSRSCSHSRRFWRIPCGRSAPTTGPWWGCTRWAGRSGGPQGVWGGPKGVLRGLKGGWGRPQEVLRVWGRSLKV